MERHAVPQNIMEVEFKLFGALSIRQFGYLAAGFVIAALVYFTGLPFLIKMPIALFVAIMGVVLALVKVNGQPASTFITNFISAMLSSQIRVWRKTPSTPEVLQEDKTLQPQIDEQLVRKVKKERAIKIAEIPLSGLSKQVRTRVDEQEEQRLKQIEDHFDFELKGLSNSPVKAEMRNEVQLPRVESRSKVPNISQQQPITKITNGNLAGNVSEGSNAEPIIQSQDHVTMFKPANNTEINRGINSASKGNVSISLNEPSLQSETVLAEDKAQAKEQERLTQLKNEIDILQGEVTQLEKHGQPTSATDKQKTENIKNTSQSINLITGVVVDKSDNLIASAVLNIKDEKGALVRKVNSDNKGRFSLKNPLPSGVYYVDIVASGYKFDRFRVTLDNSVLPLFKFRSK